MKYYISVILCCYNSQKFIKETLKSIKEQTFKNYELIIIDDGSEDETVRILENFIEVNQEIVIKLIKQNNMGLPKARNVALSHCKYNLIAIIDHDDIWVNNKLSEQISHIKKNENCYLFFSDFQYLNYNSINSTRFKISALKDKFLPYKLNLKKKYSFVNLSILGCFIGSSTVIFKKEVINTIGNFDENYKFLTDYIFFLKLSKNYDIYCSKSVLSKWRYHKENATTRLNKVYIKEMNILYLKLIKDNDLNINQKIKIIIKYMKFNIKNNIL